MDRPRFWINPDDFHSGQGKHDCPVTDSVPRDAVATPTYRDGQVMSTCELDTADHVGRIHRPDHGQWVSVNDAVEHGARRVVAKVVLGRSPAPADHT